MTTPVREVITEVVTQNPVTSVVSAAAIVSPAWLDYLRAYSEIAALLLPIFGALWIIIQMVSHFKKRM